MQAFVDNMITVVNPSQDLRQWCEDYLTLDNPEYFKRERMGKWVGNTPRKIALYERVGRDLCLPFGCIQKLLDMRKDGDRIRSAIKLRRHDVDYQSHIVPFDYQEKAIHAAIGVGNGVLVMPCGSGKTQTALEIIARLGLPCLWLTHTQDLMYQSMARAKSVLDIDNGTYGTITGGKVSVGSGITFATIQTMCRLDLSRYRDMWGVIVVDECHHAIGSPTKVMQFYKVLSGLSCRYKFGLTATPERADGLERSMFALLGDIVYEVSKEDTRSNVCPVMIRDVMTGYRPDLNAVLAGDGTINYSQLMDDLTANADRFQVVMQAIDSAKDNGAMLVLASRVEYLKRLSEEYNARYGDGSSLCLSAIGKNKRSRQLRKDALIALNEGRIKCLFATYQIAKEGLDVPDLRTVVFATPEKDPTTIKQSAGRVERKSDGKDHGTVIDLVDDFGMFVGWKRKRNSIYKKCDFILT